MTHTPRDLTDEETKALGDAWAAIETKLELPDFGPSYQIDQKGAAVLGKLMYDYMLATIYDCNWEGYVGGDVQGIKALFNDIYLFADNGGMEETYNSESES